MTLTRPTLTSAARQMVLEPGRTPMLHTLTPRHLYGRLVPAPPRTTEHAEPSSDGQTRRNGEHVMSKPYLSPRPMPVEETTIQPIESPGWDFTISLSGSHLHIDTPDLNAFALQIVTALFDANRLSMDAAERLNYLSMCVLADARRDPTEYVPDENDGWTALPVEEV